MIGVAVNPAFENPRTARAALRSVKKLREFMNLDYPVATDGGKVLESFGDPRRLDAKLPLWVVIDSEGKVAGYKVGFYRIKADEGLRQLDELVIRLIREKRKKSSKKSYTELYAYESDKSSKSQRAGRCQAPSAAGNDCDCGQRTATSAN